MDERFIDSFILYNEFLSICGLKSHSKTTRPITWGIVGHHRMEMNISRTNDENRACNCI